MDPLLFKAILAMDSYNRGYNSSVKVDELATHIGTALILPNSSIRPATQAGDAFGFFATAYSWNGETIISYRGTDAFLVDIVTGYPTGAGLVSAQSILAARFYLDVVQNTGDRSINPDVWVTGHSLGAGLAGHTAALYGANAVLFDAMPFQYGADATLTAATLAYGLTGSSEIYGTDNPAVHTLDLGGINHFYMPAASYQPWTNFLETIRLDPALPGAPYDFPMVRISAGACVIAWGSATARH
ncbi:MAG TPA: hypothetical protein VK474_13515 [Chthoniobacterales bacterium]|nr:hypothetical protein [Chthoniobacterales bacterium]